MERAQVVEQWGIRVGLLGEEKVTGGVKLKWRDGNELFKLPQVLQKYKQNLQRQFPTSCLRLCGHSSVVNHIIKYNVYGFWLRT